LLRVREKEFVNCKKVIKERSILMASQAEGRKTALMSSVGMPLVNKKTN